MRLISVLLALFVTLMATPVQALEHYKFAVGTGLNVNNNKTNGENLNDIHSVSSLDFNVAVKEQLKLTDRLLFRTGLWLQEKTIRFDEDGFYNDAFEFNTLYLSVPVTFEFMFTKGFSVYTGYIADFKLNDYCRTDDDLNGCEQLTESENIVHNATLGVTFNAGGLIAFDVNYQHALSDTYKKETGKNTFSARTNTVSAMIFFRLF